jgi:hypothetical protein
MTSAFSYAPLRPIYFEKKKREKKESTLKGRRG